MFSPVRGLEMNADFGIGIADFQNPANPGILAGKQYPLKTPNLPAVVGGKHRRPMRAEVCIFKSVAGLSKSGGVWAFQNILFCQRTIREEKPRKKLRD